MQTFCLPLSIPFLPSCISISAITTSKFVLLDFSVLYSHSIMVETDKIGTKNEADQQSNILPTRTGKRSASPSTHRKPCSLCSRPKDVLVRCQIDETLQWNFVCPGRCWRSVSGGEIDGPDHPFYRYGGMWKNKHSDTMVSAKKRKTKKISEIIRPWNADNTEYVHNDKIKFNDKMWICRRSHFSNDQTPPTAYRYWKQLDDTI